MNLDKIWHQPSKEEIKKQIADQIDADYVSDKNEDKKVEKPKTDFRMFDTRGLIHFENFDPEEVYDWYKTAIARRNREPLSKDSFMNHFFGEERYDKNFGYGNKEKGYLLGFDKFGVFVPSHFAPKTLRGGYDLIASLGESDDIPAILAVSEDLALTLDKMPSWHHLDIDKKIMSYFHGNEIKKDIYYNSHPDTENLAYGLMIEYFNRGF
jgi:hypothetical protein